MSDLQVCPGHGNLLVRLCSSADDILKGVLLLCDLCTSQGNSKVLGLSDRLQCNGCPHVTALSAQHRKSRYDYSHPILRPSVQNLRLSSYPKLYLDVQSSKGGYLWKDFNQISPKAIDVQLCYVSRETEAQRGEGDLIQAGQSEHWKSGVGPIIIPLHKLNLQNASLCSKSNDPLGMPRRVIPGSASPMMCCRDWPGDQALKETQKPLEDIHLSLHSWGSLDCL